MTMLTVSLLFNLVLWSIALTCHARLQSGWQRRRKWSPSRPVQQIMQAGRAILPALGLILSIFLTGSEGVVGWVASASLAGVLIALGDAWRAPPPKSQRVVSSSGR
ncbi:hypothetical protein [Acetobacter sp.]|jgi:hypothetical protein|uniref:hypothetical protein n=1 Tax=Acetobacter sp. TaxID=440 RepID=UPI0025C72C48|nr:hypothetical protein [Acetobacter sp.]MCH4090293.1 hypothetical protein [Acetobacter sp.]MCI1298987.1 hypothetical protein [Acetobacter sp.]MCI1315007.1 hypothetical protein [Acetobacter sp.]